MQNQSWKTILQSVTLVVTIAILPVALASLHTLIISGLIAYLRKGSMPTPEQFAASFSSPSFGVFAGSISALVAALMGYNMVKKIVQKTGLRVLIALVLAAFAYVVTVVVIKLPEFAQIAANPQNALPLIIAVVAVFVLLHFATSHLQEQLQDKAST